MSYQDSKLFTEDQKDLRMAVKGVIARQESAGRPIKPYLTACVNFDIEFIESYDSRIAEMNKNAEGYLTMLFWENISSTVNQYK